MARLMDIYIRRVVDYLSDEGMKIIEKAARSKDSGNISGNQLDAYGYIVYYNGVVKRFNFADEATSIYGDLKHSDHYERWYRDPDNVIGAKHKGWAKMGIPDATGSEWAQMFKQQFKPPKKGFCLVVFNAAFYSKLQEEGYGGKRKPFRKWAILSQVVGDMKDLKEKFHGAELRGHKLDI